MYGNTRMHPKIRWDSNGTHFSSIFDAHFDRKKKKMAIEASKWRSKGGQHRRGLHTHIINFRMLEVVFRENYCHCWIKHTLLGISSLQHCDWIYMLKEDCDDLWHSMLLYKLHFLMFCCWSLQRGCVWLHHHKWWVNYEWCALFSLK